MNTHQVAFVDVTNMQALVRQIGLERILTDLAEAIETDFIRWEAFDKTARVPAHSPEGVIELMPTSDGNLYSFKYVNGHPDNPARGLQTVTAFGVLSDVESGYPLLLSEMTLLTALRTAATSAMAARAVMNRPARAMALIGNGAQSEFQAIAFKQLLGTRTLRLYDTDPKATQKCVANLASYGFELVVCDSIAEAVANVDVITTITADKHFAQILSQDMIRAGVHLNAVGGDCPGKTELDPGILKQAEIFVEYAPQTRVEGESQQLPHDHPVTPIWQVLAGKNVGQRDQSAVTVFDSVGFAIEDFSALHYVYRHLMASAHQQKPAQLDLIAQPKDPKDLFGLLAPPQLEADHASQAVMA
ncbi:MAG: ornithine cyclodeaminase [Burkholderiaceae bacterium]